MPGVVVDDRRDLLVRVDRQELGLELLVRSRSTGIARVRQTDLLEHDGYLAAVRRRPGVEIDHECALDHTEGAILLSRALAMHAAVSDHERVEPEARTMPLVILTVAIQVITSCIVRSGRDMRWLFLIIFLPMVGCLAYLIIEVLPSLRRSPRAACAQARAERRRSESRRARRLAELRAQPEHRNRRSACGELTRAAVTPKRFASAPKRARPVRGRPEDPAALPAQFAAGDTPPRS